MDSCFLKPLGPAIISVTHQISKKKKIWRRQFENWGQKEFVCCTLARFIEFVTLIYISILYAGSLMYMYVLFNGKIFKFIYFICYSMQPECQMLPLGEHKATIYGFPQIDFMILFLVCSSVVQFCHVEYSRS